MTTDVEVAPPPPLKYEEIVPGLGWARVYWYNCEAAFMKLRGARFSPEVQDAPTTGHSTCFVIEREDAKFVTLFCPYTFSSYQVSRRSSEWDSLRPIKPKDDGWLSALMQRQWNETSKLGLVRDFDTAARIFKNLGLEVPSTSTGARDADKIRGGKEVMTTLKRPIKKESRRGAVLSFFLNQQGASARAAMDEFGISRSNVLSQLHCLQKDHGVGYTVKGDAIFVHLPEGYEEDDVWVLEE